MDFILQRSTILTPTDWTGIASWLNGAAPVLAPGVTLVRGSVRDASAGSRALYRFQVIHRN